MKQILHIFAKDARRFLPEIVISLALYVGFVATGASIWIGGNNGDDQLLVLLASLLVLLVPVSWWILITRSIQGERLVGDTQFWITRPYVWSKLLAAKALFLFGFLCVPFFLAQFLLLAESGFAPQHLVPGLLFNLLLIVGVVVLPLTALAATTSNFARMTLLLLGIFVVLVAASIVLALLFSVYNSGPGDAGSGLGGKLCMGLTALLCGTAAVLQYAWRRVWITRAVLLALPVLMLAAMWAAGKYDQAQVPVKYPVTAAAPVQFAPVAMQSGMQSMSFPNTSRAMIPVTVQITETGVAEGYAVVPEMLQAEITASDGSHWKSDWGVGEGIGFHFLGGDTRVQFNAGFSIPIAEYWKFQSKPLKLRLTYAVAQARASEPLRIALSNQRFAVPGFGVCLPQTGWAPTPGQITGLNCVSALHEPQLTFVTTHWSDGGCSTSAEVNQSGVLGSAWVGQLEPGIADLSITPVVDLHLQLTNNTVNDAGGQPRPRYLCPGTPITFTRYTPVARSQTSVDIPDFRLPAVRIAGPLITVTQ